MVKLHLSDGSFNFLLFILQEYMPVPPADAVAEQENGDKTASGPAASAPAAPALQFSYVECLLYTLHQIGKKCPEFLSAADNEEVTERMKDLKLRWG